MRPYLRHALAATSALIVVVVAPGCGSRTNLGCRNAIPLVKEPPNLYFMLDRSGSMTEQDKWKNERSAISGLISKLGSKAVFGAAVFPSPNDDACATGIEVMPPQAGVDDPTPNNAVAQAFLQATSDTPLGGTPTASTIASLTPQLQALPGHTFVILATDGGPNCNANITCTIDRCTSNIDGLDPKCQPGKLPNCCTSTPPPDGPQGCLDEQGTIDATSALFRAGIPMFVIGVPGSEPYRETLDAVAQAGGEPRPGPPFYYKVDTADELALASALADIVDKVSITCDVKLAVSVYAELDVALNDEPVASGANDGWTVSGDRLSFHGASCTKVLAGASIAVHDYDECAH